MDGNYLYILNINNFNDKDYNYAFNKVSEYRKTKTNKCINDSDKKLSIYAELLLRYALDSLNIQSRFEFSFNEYDKPYLEDTGIYFNISHCGHYVICAVSQDEIGCDIELIKEYNDKVAKEFLNEKEYQTLSSVTSLDKKANTYYRLWTLKESFVKNIGIGMSVPLNSFSFELLNDVQIRQTINNNEYFFDEIELKDYKCAVCNSNNRVLNVVTVNKQDLLR